MPQAAKCLMIAATGTGGHVFPGLAVAEVARQQGITVVWLGTPDGMERRFLPKDMAHFAVAFGGLRGKGWRAWLRLPYRLMRAVFQSARALRTARADTLLVMGGYISAPAAIAAFILRIPIGLHEQNARRGSANRLIAPVAKVICEGFLGTFPAKFHHKCVHTGNPTRADITRASSTPRHLVMEGNAPLRILILGGSQGARAFNVALPALLSEARINLHTRPNLDIWHQYGKHTAPDYQRTQQGAETFAETFPHAPKNEPEGAQYPARIKVRAYATAFIDPIAEAYAWADIVIARAGAMTVSELAVSGLPAILIPFPYATDNHQQANAEYLARTGRAWVMAERDLTTERLTTALRHALNADIDTGAHGSLFPTESAARVLRALFD